MSTPSTATGSSTAKTPSAASTTSPPKQNALTTPKPASATSVESITVVSVVEQTDSFVALSPAPTETQQSQPSSTQESPQSTQQTTNKPRSTSERQLPTSSISPEASSHTIVPIANTQTTLSTQLQTNPRSSLTKSSSLSPSPSLVPLSNGSPFQGSNDGDAAASKPKNIGATVAGVVGGLSAAILLGVLGFFLWKWKTRGKYRFNKRTSFGPYGNGIDANRGGLLVSSVACKPADSLSNHEESLYSDENSPTRYDRPSFDLNRDLNREPTLPSVGELSEKPIISPTSPPKAVHFGMDRAISSSYPGQPSYRPGDPMMAVAGVAPLMARTSMRQPGGGILYQPRRPPAPPSMRRNRSPPQPPQGPGGEEGDYLSAGNPNMMPRSNTIGGKFSNRALPNLPYGAAPPNGRMPMRQVRRSTSLNGMDNRYGHSNNSGFDPLSMHPVIPEVPSGPTTPVPRDSANMDTISPSNSITRSPVEMHRATPASGRSNPMTVPRPPMPDRWSTLTSDSDKPKVLTIRNPSPEREKEKESGIGSIVRRVSSLRQDREHTVKPELAAKNF